MYRERERGGVGGGRRETENGCACEIVAGSNSEKKMGEVEKPCLWRGFWRI